MGYDNKTYLRELGVHKCVIKDVKKGETKEKKPKLVVVFERPTDGALVDASFMLPMNDISTKQFKSLCEAVMGPGGASGKKLPEVAAALKGQTLAILVAPSPKLKGDGFWWNVRNYWPAKYLDGVSDLDSLGGFDDLGFGEEPKTADDDTIPF